MDIPIRPYKIEIQITTGTSLLLKDFLDGNFVHFFDLTRSMQLFFFFLLFFLFQFDKKEKLSYKRTNTTHKYFKVSGTNNRVKTPITVAHYKI